MVIIDLTNTQWTKLTIHIQSHIINKLKSTAFILQWLYPFQCCDEIMILKFTFVSTDTTWDYAYFTLQQLKLGFPALYFVIKGHAVVQWLRHCATNRKVAGSIADGVRIFHWHNPSGRTMALGSTQPLTEMSTYQECFLGVKAAGAQSWQPCNLHVPIVMKFGSLNLLEPLGPVKVCNGIAFLHH
jgi:hypothetical protein